MTPKQALRQNVEVDDTKELELADVWKFLLRRWWTIAICGLVGFCVGFLLYVRASRLYTAVITVEMNRDATSGLGLQDLSGAGSALGIGSDFMTDILTQQSVLTNASTAISVIQDLNLMTTPPYSSLSGAVTTWRFADVKHPILDPETVRMERAVAIFDSKLAVRPVKNTRLMDVAYTDPDPNRAAQIANAVVEAYLTNHTRTRFEATSKASTWLGQQLLDLKRQTEATHKQVEGMERDSGLSSMSALSSGTGSTAGSAGDIGASNPDIAKLMELNRALSQAELTRIQQGTLYRLSQTNDPGALLDMSGARAAIGGSSLASDNPRIVVIQQLRNQETQLKLRIAQEKVTYGAKSPIMQAIQNQLDVIHEQIASEIAPLRDDAQRTYKLAEQNEQAIRAEVEKQQVKVSSLGNRMSDLAFLREQEGSSRKLYQELYSRLEEADIAAGVRSSGMAVVDPARPPSSVSSPVLKSDVSTGLAAGILVGLLIALVLHIRDTRLNIPSDFEALSPYPLLGVVPGFEFATNVSYGATTAPSKAAINDQAWILRAPSSPVAEAYRSIRTSILLARIDAPAKVMLFTSSLSGDGKSTTAYNLAAAFAAQSTRVLLLDADMRRSTIAKLAGLAKGRGLSDVLSGGATIDEVLHANPHIANLTVMQAGTVPPDPSELLGSKRFENLVLELRKRFDYILIDSPPALLVTDPVVASSVADGIICVVRAGKTDKHSLSHFWEAMRRPLTPVLGYIVNDFNRKLHSYAYGYEGYGTEHYRYYGTKESV